MLKVKFSAMVVESRVISGLNNPKNFKAKNESKANFVFQSEIKPQNTVIDAKGTLINQQKYCLTRDVPR